MKIKLKPISIQTCTAKEMEIETDTIGARQK